MQSPVSVRASFARSSLALQITSSSNHARLFHDCGGCSGSSTCTQLGFAVARITWSPGAAWRAIALKYSICGPSM